MEDVCYVARVGGDITQTLYDPVRTVLTLSHWGLVTLTLLSLGVELAFRVHQKSKKMQFDQ